MRAAYRLAWLLALAAASGAVALAAENGPGPRRATLCVGLWTLWHDRQIVLAPDAAANASLRVCDARTGCTASALIGPLAVRAAAGESLTAGNRTAASIELTGLASISAHGETLALRYPLRITTRNGELVLAVTMPVESYVERVVESESGAADRAESLQALAIVVRSFALHVRHGHAGYDVCDSTHCQLLRWGGRPDPAPVTDLRPPTLSRPVAEKVRDHEPFPSPARAHAATLATAGETLWFRGQRAAAWFHQSCGGRTATPSEAWPGGPETRKPMPWLASRTDRYCTAGGAREWSAELSLAELTSALAAAGLARPGWRTLSVASRGDSGRAVTLRIDAKEISAEDLRLAVGRSLGWGHILSNWFEVARSGDRFVFHGRGSGHGVGLCQAGAAAMAAGGSDADAILAQYFPGAVVADEASGRPWLRWQSDGFALESLDAADAARVAELSLALAEAESRSGLRPVSAILVRAFGSTEGFREATLAQGWVAAFTEGDWIGTQPLATLEARRLLVPTMRHEFLHALVEERASAAAPLWLREGLVAAWADSDRPRSGPAPALALAEVDRALAHAASEAQSADAHRAAEWYAAALLRRFGREQVTGWLQTGVPASAAAAVH